MGEFDCKKCGLGLVYIKSEDRWHCARCNTHISDEQRKESVRKSSMNAFDDILNKAHDGTVF